jgi:hypothetical protein
MKTANWANIFNWQVQIVAGSGAAFCRRLATHRLRLIEKSCFALAILSAVDDRGLLGAGRRHNAFDIARAAPDPG